MRKQLTWSLAAILCAGAAAGCEGRESAKAVISATGAYAHKDFTFDVRPETFEITLSRNGVKESVSLPLPVSPVSRVVRKADTVTWSIPGKADIQVRKKENYLDVTITSTGAETFQWPRVTADSYLLPLGEGKKIPANDASWMQFLKEETLNWSESFSMDFFALNKQAYSIVYIVKNKFNNEVRFKGDSAIGFDFSHEFPSLTPDKSYGFRLYVTDNDPVSAAKTYQAYRHEMEPFLTLADKAKANPEVAKLFGAPHIYLWNEQLLAETDVDWSKIRSRLESPLGPWIAELLAAHTEDGAGEFNSVLKQMRAQDYFDAYQKKIVLRAMNAVLKLKPFYKAELFPDLDSQTLQLAAKGTDRLSKQQTYELNKKILKSALQDAVTDIGTWGEDHSAKLVEDMKQAGIANAWIGLPNWSDGLMNPGFVRKTNEQGYLIGPYDSYHSIQQKENPSWNTAYFPDSTLYEQATIAKKDGTKIGGFLGRGRKLNPALSLPSVKQRTQAILQDGIAFNSWFIDCDATGEIYDDYTAAHPTTQLQDLKARLERIAYIANEKKMVVGSEGGSDYAHNTIAFAHGIETPVIQWADPDMRTDKSSEYYVGDYYSPQGTIPERYGKQVPIKPLYHTIYTDPAYSVPLYKLVYNDSVITTHHWEWGSDKIKGEVGDRMLKELLYNVPPLYHLDRQVWEKEKARITAYLKVWSPFHKKAVNREMTGFRILSEDRLVQRTEYGPDLNVTVNFSDKEARIGDQVLPAKSAVIQDGPDQIRFDPQILLK
ncbi:MULTISPECIES: glycoside hydrolase [unclassified Paenibacillus]|uniref:glycoside hydrolase n=1 Tax=unclassified Paenibacillus TaxID=185978 RepID=UPI00020D7A07|nr:MULTISPECIES: glycoside hydrolase [unclassified Paenibacillus]EGL19056.1 hypothetical protein HMPREF9413_0836 [Paenibacillus sp. HGF7]EPD81206.1 hypothetical protein HMPREF1207_04963 [Paenibacillus sp. HGH0039]